MELFSYLQGLVKSILREDELHCAQIELILTEALENLPESVSVSEATKLKEKIEQFKTIEESQLVLSKALQCYTPIKVF